MAIQDGYGICFNEWALDTEIKTELGLLLIISSLCANDGVCFAGNDYLSELFKVDNVSISRKLNKLKKLGYITIDYDRNGTIVTKRKIRLTKMLTAVNKNVKDKRVISAPLESGAVEEKDDKINNDDYLLKSSKDDIWMETTIIQHKLKNQETMYKYLKLFRIHLISSLEQKKSYKDFCTHFKNWLRKQKIETVEPKQEKQRYV